MPGDLTGVDLKIKRAKKHLHDLEGMWSGFLETNPYEFVSEDDPQTGEQGLIVRRADPLPLCLSVLAGDVVHNLRSALDQLIWQLVRANGGQPEKNPRAYAFPIWDSQAKCEHAFPGTAKGASETALSFLKALEPYKGRDDALWAINHLDIVDKHRLLVTVAGSHGLLAVGPHYTGDKSDLTTFEEIIATPENPIEYAPRNMPPLKVGTRFNVGQDFKPFPLVALDEPGIGEREPLIPTLHELVGFTERLVIAFAEGENWGRHSGTLLNITLVPASG